MQGPERFLTDLGVTLPCAVDPSKQAVFDTAHRVLVNHEAYFVSSGEALLTFVAEPYKFSGKVTDPVSLVRFQPNDLSPRRSHGGRLFFFETNQTAAAFDGNLEMYGIPRPMMKEKT